MQDPILYVGKFENELTELIHEYGDYLFMVFGWACFFFIAWLLFRKRKAPSRASARTQAIVGIILTSPASSEAGSGRTPLMMADDPSRN